MFGRIFRPGEYTKVTSETEIGIPVMTYVVMAVSGCGVVIGSHIKANLRVLSKWLQQGYTTNDWFVQSYGPHMKERWPLLLAWCIAWCIGFPILVLLFRLTIEQMFKQWKIVDPFAWIGSLIPKFWTLLGMPTSKYEPPKEKEPSIKVRVEK
jgi:hypothetical protein